MFLVSLFWFGLLFPGYVLVRHFSAQDLKSGLLGTIGLSYLAAFAALSPFSIVAYLLHLPAMFMSAVCLSAIVASIVEIARRRWWVDLARLAIAGLSVMLLILVADLVMSARVGSFLDGDTKTHIARIRHIVDHGFSSDDPYVTGGHFFPSYHTNLLHGLHAACIRLTGANVFDEWFINLLWAKLAIAGGYYFLGWSLFQSHWVAGLTVVYFLGNQAPVPFLVYPNKLSPDWLMPLMAGFAMQTFRSPCSWRTPLWMAAGSLVLGQVHGLYAVFAGIGLAPYLAVVFLARLWKRGPDHRRVAACILALFAGAPFVLVGKVGLGELGRHTQEQIARDQRFIHFDDGQSMLKPSRPVAYALLALGVLCALVGDRRKQAGFLIIGAATAAAIVYIPSVCTAAIKLFGPQHTVYRMRALESLARTGLVPGAVSYLLEPHFRWRWAREAAVVVTFFLGMQLASESQYSWSNYWNIATASPGVRHNVLDFRRNARAFFQEYIPAGAVVLTDERTAMYLVMSHDCHVVIHERLRHGIPDVYERIADLNTMLAADTTWRERSALLRKYGIELLLVGGGGNTPPDWTVGHLRQGWKTAGYLLVSLDTR